MDPLTGLLEGPQARGAFVVRMVMEPPWAIRVCDQAPLTIAAVVSGEVDVTAAVAEPCTVGAGEIVVLRGPDPYDFASPAGTPVQIIVHPGQHCEDTLGRSLEEPLTQGVRTWGNDPDGRSVIIVGTYEYLGEGGSRILSELPPVLRVDGREVGAAIVDLIAAELTRDIPGQGVVLDRLLDLLAVSVLRHWFESRGSEAPGWWRATSDPIVGPALRLLQHNPAHAWTVANLAAAVGASRASLARRFADLVGQPPMAFLTEWRLDAAADLLLMPNATLESVAAEVGYSSGFALSAAFKRVRGLSPSDHRREVATSSRSAAPASTLRP